VEYLNHQTNHRHRHLKLRLPQQKKQQTQVAQRTVLPAAVLDVVLEHFFLKAGSTQKRVSPPSGHKDYNHARYRQDEKEGDYRYA
jgi:hypothetical protein